MTYDKSLLQLCRQQWMAMSRFRLRRSKALDYTFGRHWHQEYSLPDGRITTREREARAQGKIPVTNNLTRQLIKTVVGKWRFLRSRHKCGDAEDSHALSQALSVTSTQDIADGRALEEFIISGLTAQLITAEGEIRNISPSRLILSKFTAEDAGDVRLMGVLHDMSPMEILHRFGQGDGEKCRRLSGMLSRVTMVGSNRFATPDVIEFDTPSEDRSVRVIEVWERTAIGVMRVHDIVTGSYFIIPDSREVHDRLSKINDERKRRKEAELNVLPDVVEAWCHIWLSTDGMVIEREYRPVDERPPLIIRAYPMIDGEIHSLVEDILPQQEYVNRLVEILDDTLEHSAKGVLLYPTDQLPHGMTWEELRRVWSTPGSIIPFVRNSRNITPVQINSAGTSQGASDMLKVQLEMFGRISGITFVGDNQGYSVNSADMLRRRIEQETVALLDVLSAFESFLSERDRYLKKGGGKSE